MRHATRLVTLAALITVCGCDRDPVCRGSGGGPPDSARAHACVLRRLEATGYETASNMVREVPSPVSLPWFSVHGVLSPGNPTPSAYCFVHTAGVACSIGTEDQRTFQTLVTTYQLGAKAGQLDDEQWLRLTYLVLREGSFFVYGDPASSQKVFADMPAELRAQAKKPQVTRPPGGGVHVEYLRTSPAGIDRIEVNVDPGNHLVVQDEIFQAWQRSG